MIPIVKLNPKGGLNSFRKNIKRKKIEWPEMFLPPIVQFDQNIIIVSVGSQLWSKFYIRMFNEKSLKRFSP